MAKSRHTANSLRLPSTRYYLRLNLKREVKPKLANDQVETLLIPLALLLTQPKPALPKKYLQRLVRNYGTCLFNVLEKVTDEQDLGLHFGADLYQREVDYLIRDEWATTAEDVLWRRTKRGLYLNEEQVAALAGYISNEFESEHKPKGSDDEK